MQIGQRTVTDPVGSPTEIGTHRLHPLHCTTWTRLRSGAGILAQRLTLPDLRQGTDEDLRRPVDLPGAANAARNSGGKDGNAPRETRRLGSTDFAFDQRLACSDQNWHTGGVAR
jgi:hypothetical protein